jgi:hypothetical protein
MRSIYLMLAGMLVPLLATVPTGRVYSDDTGVSSFVARQDASPADYGACPAAEAICYYYHGPAAVVTNYCNGFDCFEMTYFEQARVVAADEEGVFPRTFMAWFTDKRSATPWISWSTIPCVIQRSGNKFKLKLPEGSNICGAGMLTPEAAYYWHAASDPTTGCLGIGECKLPLIYDLSVPPAE